MSVEKAVGEYLLAKCINVAKGTHDTMIEAWANILRSKYSDEDAVEACRIASMKPGRPEVSHIIESAKARDAFKGAI